MTFATFEQAVKKHCPNVESVAPHGSGEFGGGSYGSVAVVFRTGKQKLYFYNGSYISILTRLGAKVTTRAAVESIEQLLTKAENQHGKQGLFGNVIDNTQEIEYWRNRLAQEKACVIID